MTMPDTPDIYSVTLEGVSFTLVDPYRGHEAAFHEWYGLDHFYAGGVMVPYVMSGRRWYASAAMRKSRYSTDVSPIVPPEAGMHLATYFVATGGLESFRAWAERAIPELRSRGRMFAARTHVHTHAYRYQRSLAFPEASDVDPLLALDHGFPGLCVVLTGPSTRREQTSDLPAGSLALAFELDEAQLGAGVLGTDQPDAISEARPSGGLVLLFLPGGPPSDVEGTAALAEAVSSHVGGEARWAGGFRPITAGDASYLAELR
jgi:hypothetical protein